MSPRRPLKPRWEEQIEKFTDSSTLLINGTRPKRLLQYQQKTDYHITNYEQVIHDCDDINHLLQADVIILDEAQRIKNWQNQNRPNDQTT